MNHASRITHHASDTQDDTPSSVVRRPSSVATIIINYNYGRFLGEAIESVLAQTLRPDEIIVVDDGSTDDSAEVAARYAQEGVRYIYKENGGQSSACNVGIKESASELVTFLDADDRWLPDKIERQVEHLRSYPEVGLVTGSEWETDEAGRKVWLMERKGVASASLYPRILVENYIGTPSLVMIRRECFNGVGVFDEKIRLAQDWDMWIRVAREYPIAVLGEPLILYRRHNASISAGSGSTWKRYFSNRAFQRKHIRPVRPALTRVKLLAAAQSMNLFYTAASLADTGTRRGTTFWLALLSALLDPTYQGKLKLGLVMRTALGKNAFKLLRRVLPARP
ncbi:MAG TPA: glycosyltransferase family A protein [Chloroflexia bacterium]|nr:glycosyltransferase family A protein [Chloroflexia bacterium]